MDLKLGTEPRNDPIVVDGEPEGVDIEALSAAVNAASLATAGKPLVGAAKAAHEKKQLAALSGGEQPPFKRPIAGYSGPMVPYPFHDTGANDEAAIRMIKMVKPFCPADPRPDLVLRNGTTIANPRYTGEENCQLAYRFNNQGRWDVERCMELGHDPWRTEFRKTIVSDVVDEDGWVTEKRERVRIEHRLNVVQSSVNPRHTSGTDVALELARGSRFLTDFGILSPCEFRNCSRPVEIKTRFGNYCTERHARLVGADLKRILLPVGGDPYSEGQALEERGEMLENINIALRG